MGRGSVTWQVVWVGALLLVISLGGLEAGKLSEEDLAELDLTEEERAVLRLQGKESDEVDDFDYNPLGKKGAGPDEEDVVVLVPSEFGSFLKGNQYVLVQFHAPWCGHCAKLTPEFAKAATALKEKDVVLAKVDAVEHMDFAADEGVEGYPTLYFYADGVKKPYTGGRSSDEIISWVERRIGPTVSIIKSAEEVLESENPIAVAYLDSVDGNDAQEFIGAATEEDGVEFHMTADAEVAKKFGLDKKTPALVLLKKENEKVAIFDGLFETKAISDFVSENKLPLVITFSRETANLVFNADIKNQMLLFANPSEFEKMRENYEAAAKSSKKKILFVFVDLADVDAASPVLEFFALDNVKTRLLAYVADRSVTKYLYDGDYSLDSLKQFSEKFLAGNLIPYLKSQKPPAENPGPVKIVVASTFKEIVLDETKDVILEIYAPWCGACKSLELEYNKLGEALKDTSSIVVARIDGTKNEIEGLQMDRYPTVLFYPATKNAEPVSFV
ncbi:hypothetical protein KC19_8G187000 [Ceratodon purpureus]|uniref:protein disulfide-isomerase n=1 Tax=Ceratodon purpureus TaxID=3225 RepID=A0A8T0H4Z0_CERPU|nr:hypothetical protein KC19_8G187000 [Ceratodon purpureus]